MTAPTSMRQILDVLAALAPDSQPTKRLHVPNEDLADVPLAYAKVFNTQGSAASAAVRRVITAPAHSVEPIVKRARLHREEDLLRLGWLWVRTVDESGQLLSGSYMDYCMPRADDFPTIKVGLTETPCTHNPLGVKGCGEAGAIAAPAAVMNAVSAAEGAVPDATESAPRPEVEAPVDEPALEEAANPVPESVETTTPEEVATPDAAFEEPAAPEETPDAADGGVELHLPLIVR